MTLNIDSTANTLCFFFNPNYFNLRNCFGIIYIAVNSVGAPSELTLDVSLVPPYDSVVEHYIGGKTEMKVEVQFPEATTSAVTIELLPSTNVTIMALGEITVTPPASGSLTKTGSDAVTRHITDETKGVS